MNTIEMNEYLEHENDNLKIQVRKWKTKCRYMEQLNREMFQILQEKERDAEGLKYMQSVMLGVNDE